MITNQCELHDQQFEKSDIKKEQDDVVDNNFKSNNNFKECIKHEYEIESIKCNLKGSINISKKLAKNLKLKKKFSLSMIIPAMKKKVFSI